MIVRLWYSSSGAGDGLPWIVQEGEREYKAADVDWTRASGFTESSARGSRYVAVFEAARIEWLGTKASIVGLDSDDAELADTDRPTVG